MKRFFILLSILSLLLVLIVVVFLLPSDPVEQPTSVPDTGGTGTPGEVTPFPVQPEDVAEAYLPKGYVYDPNKKELNQILSVLPSPNFTPVLDSLYTDYYSIVPCRQNGLNESVLRLVFDDSRASRKTMSDYEVLMFNWESDMVRDIGDLVFQNISTAERNVVLRFSDASEAGFRSAPVSVAGVKRSIYYGFDANVMYIGGSMECIEKVDETIWGPNHEH